jgi:histone-lysine N-methyltransferase SETMAR
LSDKSWIYGYDPETKQQSSQGKSPQSPRAKNMWQVQSSTKSMVNVCFFYVKGIVHSEFVPPITMVNSEFYCDVLRRLKENMQRERPEIWKNHNWLLHHDVPTHTCLKTTEFVTNNNMVIVSHPPYSLDLAPCEFALFPKLKMKLTGQHFETVVLDSIKENTPTVLLQHRKNDGITVYVPKETILKEMAAKIE